jgi:futalosine hydrolase
VTPAILVVCALPAELRGFAAPDGVDVLACGVGPVEAAIATARALATKRYDFAINAGIGGAFRGSAEVGDARIITRERLAALGLEGGGTLTLPDGASLVDEVAADAGLVTRCAALPHQTARGVTVAQVTTTDATAASLRSTYGADVESMEGFAFLRAAQLAGVPAIEVRGISNYVGDRTRAQWDFRAGSGAAVSALEAVVGLLSATA